MNYLCALFKSFLFKESAFQIIKQEKKIYSFLFYFFTETIAVIIWLLIRPSDNHILYKQIIFSFFLIFLRILVMAFLLHKTISLSKYLTGIIHANLISGTLYFYLILLNENTPLYKILDTITIIYSLYYIYRFLKVIISDINPRKIECYVIFSALLAKLLTLALLMVYNSINN